MAVLVWIEQVNGEPVASSWETLGAAKTAAEALGAPVYALVLGDETDTIAARAQTLGIDRVLTMADPQLADYRLSAYAAAVEQAVAAAGATVLMMAATTRGRELSGTVACRLGAGLAPDIVDLRVEAGKLVAVRSLYSGNILADVHFESAMQVLSVRPRAFAAPVAGARAGAVEALSFALDAGQATEQVLETRVTDSGEVSLTDAKIIVSGGRGVAADPAKGFALVTELAGVLGAAVGASRAAVDAGYIPYKHQVGQTGKTVRPDLYIAAGISGAIQHLAGMGASKMIVAINKDRDAPIFERAHYGIVGDLFEVLPALSEAFRQRLK